ncbi:MAG TPA: CoA-binding protein [Rhodocyclaceae bacterium]|nr:CoA-binding protein [Rhodocyclaceae bacterium]
MLITTDTDLKRLFETVRTIAVVGCSPKPERPGHYVAKYLQDLGYRVIPVNPGQTEILGEKCYPSLRDIPEPVDLVDCFRRAEDIPPVVEDAIAIGAKFVWMQLGIVNEAAAQRAMAAGIEVVMDRCPKIDYPRLFR